MDKGSLSPGVKQPRRCLDHSPPSSAEVKERTELYFYTSPVPSCPSLRWNVCITSEWNFIRTRSRPFNLICCHGQCRITICLSHHTSSLHRAPLRKRTYFKFHFLCETTLYFWATSSPRFERYLCRHVNSRWTDWPWRSRHYDHSKRPENTYPQRRQILRNTLWEGQMSEGQICCTFFLICNS